MASTTVKAWIKNERNSFLEMEDFWISYNPGNHLIHAFEADNGGAETALCSDGKYYILNGDYRKEYEELIDKGFDACKEFFDKNQDAQSSWSN